MTSLTTFYPNNNTTINRQRNETAICRCASHIKMNKSFQNMSRRKQKTDPTQHGIWQRLNDCNVRNIESSSPFKTIKCVRITSFERTKTQREEAEPSSRTNWTHGKLNKSPKLFSTSTSLPSPPCLFSCFSGSGFGVTWAGGFRATRKMSNYMVGCKRPTTWLTVYLPLSTILFQGLTLSTIGIQVFIIPHEITSK